MEKRARDVRPFRLCIEHVEELLKNPDFLFFNPRQSESDNSTHIHNSLPTSLSGYWRAVDRPTEAYGKQRLCQKFDDSPVFEIKWSNVPKTPRQPPDLTGSFNRLPKELQCAIWKMALPEPRVVQLRKLYLEESIKKDGIWPGRDPRCIKFGLKAREFINWKDYMTCRSQYAVFEENYHLLRLHPTPNSPLHPIKEIGYVDRRRDTFVACFKAMCSLREALDYEINMKSLEKVAFYNTDSLRLLTTTLPLWNYVASICPKAKSFTALLGDIGGRIILGKAGKLADSIQDLHILDATRSFHDEVSWETIISRNFTPPLKRMLEDAEIEVKDVLDEFREWDASSKRLPPVKGGRSFQVGFLVEKIRAKAKEIWLVPVEPHPYNVKYCTRDPSIRESYLISWHFEALTWCLKDDMLYNSYTGIKELFEPTGTERNPIEWPSVKQDM